MSSFLSDSFQLRRNKEKKDQSSSQRKDAEDRLHNFNYAKLYHASSADELDDDGNPRVKPLNRLGEAYLATVGEQQKQLGGMGGNGDGEGGDGGEDDASVSSTSSSVLMRMKSLGSGAMSTSSTALDYSSTPAKTPTYLHTTDNGEEEDDVSVLLSPTVDELDEEEEEGGGEFTDVIDSILNEG